MSAPGVQGGAGGEGSAAEALCCSRHFPGCCSLGHSCSPFKKIPGFAVMPLSGGSAVLVELLLHPSCQPARAVFPSAAGSALHILATSLVLMFSFTRMSGLFLPFKAWHLRGPSGYSPGNVGIARTFCTISFKQKQTLKISMDSVGLL